MGAAGAAREAPSRVAVLESRGRFLVAVPLFERGGRRTVDRGGPRARDGDLVLLAAERGGRGGGGGGRAGARGPSRGHARIERVLGRPDVARDVLEAMMLDRGLRRGFAAGGEAEAERAAAEAAGRGEGARRDLRDLVTFTIDPASAWDFDDAISAEDLGDGRRRILVHIADVAAHVRPGTALDREAYRRGTSVYVPGAVEPMLPAALSNRACSLVPGEDRLAVTIEMEIRGAEVRKAAFHRSLIRSDARLDYERVDEVFAGGSGATGEAPWAGPLAVARAAAAELDARRRERHALTLDSAEPEFAFDRDGHVTGMRPVAQTESHRLIEHLMIAANEQVAGLLDARKVPALYRVHEKPDPERVGLLLDQLGSLGVAIPPAPDPMSATQAEEIVGAASELVEQHVRRTGHGRAALTFLVLRALRQATYSPRNIGHAGLRSPRYCHFTSPIRRYPDLVCHRALLSSIGAGEAAPEGSGLAEAGAWASERERDAQRLERDADDVARAFLLERDRSAGRADEAFGGEVVGLVGGGAFVAFGSGYEGFLPARRLGGDWWELNAEGTMLVGQRSGRAIRLGDSVRVEVGRVDAPRGRVDLYPVEG